VGQDTITGGAGDDRITMLVTAGNGDIIDAGDGTDTLVLSGVVPGDHVLTVDLSSSTDQVASIGGMADALTQRNFENLDASGIGSSVTATGSGGDNVLIGSKGNDSLDGGAGNDMLTGGAGNDTLTGGAGNDTLDGGAGADSMTGGLGNDTYVIDNLGDTITEQAGEGTDTVNINRSVDLTQSPFTEIENVVLTGIAASNATGDDGNNLLTGNSAANILKGGDGNDTLTGNAGNDTLAGEAGDDTMDGGAGNDTYVVNSLGDNVTESLAGVAGGVDLVQSSVSFTLGANVENLTLTGTANIDGTGNELANILTGNSGDNTLDGGAGVDKLVGGAGNDTYRVDLVKVGTGATATVKLQDTITESPNPGTDTVLLRGVVPDLTKATTLTLGANLENLDASQTADTKLNLTGNTLNNMLTGNDADNLLSGQAGNDILIGGAGNDIYVVDSLGDVVTEAVGEGGDTVQVKIATAGQTYTLGDNVENATLLNTVAFNLTGNDLANVLIGNAAANTLIGGAGNDTLNGGLGADTMTGGLGDDTYIVDNVGDGVTEQPGDGTDTVQSSVSYTLGANVENLTLTGAGAIKGTGNDLANVLTGNNAANVLTGGDGNDTLIGNGGNDTLDGGLGADAMDGGGGNDTYVVDNLGDTVTETLAGAAGGTDLVKSAVSFTLGANVENLTLTGTANIDGTGNELANILTGNSGDNTLIGGAGNDTLRGGLGNDTYQVNPGDGQDKISENDNTPGNSDTLLYGATIDPLDLVLSRQVNDLRIAVHGTTDSVTIQNWYGSPTTAQVETIQAGNGQTLLNTQVDQLIQAMAAFSHKTGLTWDQAIDQKPGDVQNILAANWQS
jgi:Ca2+-binding RTX toxin-like protein